MRLDCVLTAVNENQLYLDFVPFFIDCWKALYPGVQTRVILIANEIPDRFHKYGENIILFPPIKDVSTAFTSQYIRILYPALLSEFTGGIMITDIDDMPMNRIFFTENIEAIPDDRWINMRDWRTHDQICCCWQVATQKTWMEVFKIADTSEIIARIKGVSSQVNYADTHGGDGWFTDQQDLFKYVGAWANSTGKYVSLRDADTGFNRLDRAYHANALCSGDGRLYDAIRRGEFADYHALRPYQTFKTVNEAILATIKESCLQCPSTN